MGAKLAARPAITSFLLSLLVFLGVMGLRQLGVLSSLEVATFDVLLRSRPATFEPDSRLVLITVTEDDIQAQGRWPFTDQVLAEALEKLTEYEARTIGLDLYRDLSVPPGSEAFEAILTRNPGIIVITKFGVGDEEAIGPPSVLQGTEQVSFNDLILDAGGLVRRGLLFLDDGQNVLYSFALRLVLPYLEARGIVPEPDPDNEAHIRLGASTIRPFETNDGGYVNADARGYQFLLDFHGAPESFPSYTFTDLLSGKVTPEAIKDKIVILGVGLIEGHKDFFFSPFSFGQRRDQRMAGITLHAHVASQLVRAGLGERAMIRIFPDGQEAIWCLFWSLLGGFVGLWARNLWRFVLAAAVGLITLVAVVYVAMAYDYWLPIVPPALVWLPAASLTAVYLQHQEQEQRRLLMHLFSRHVSPEVADTVWREREQFMAHGRLRPQRLNATLLFTDLVNFTTLSERMPPQDVMDWLNDYMEAMFKHVAQHNGVINKYIGDSIMALFGAPLVRTSDADVKQDAINAVNCALAMNECLIQLNRDWMEEGKPTVAMRVGIQTGPLIAGSLGSMERLEYTVIGDTVNTASRLESYDKDVFPPDPKHAPCRILVGETTARYLGDLFPLEYVTEVQLKGKTETTKVYHVTYTPHAKEV